MITFDRNGAVLALVGRVERGTGLCRIVGSLLADDALEVVTLDTADAQVDFGLVDALARAQLVARRLGCSIRVRGAGGDLRSLVELFGLTEILPGCTAGGSVEQDQR